jgi:PadR family transcriptional regulator, regulatory protein AphA
MDARTLSLGSLGLGDASGYEIKKLYEEGDLSHFYAVGFGSIYPALTRLVEEGSAECFDQPQDKRPDKKVYRITRKGRRELIRSLAVQPGPDKIRSELCFLLLFANLLPAAQIEKLIDDRIAWYREQMAEIDASEAETPDASASARFLGGLGHAIYKAAADFMATHKSEIVAAAQAPIPGTVRAAE